MTYRFKAGDIVRCWPTTGGIVQPPGEDGEYRLARIKERKAGTAGIAGYTINRWYGDGWGMDEFAIDTWLALASDEEKTKVVIWALVYPHD